MLNFFAILLIIFTGLILLIFKKGTLFKVLNIKNLYTKKLIKKQNNNYKIQSKKRNFSYRHDEKKYSEFYKNSQRNKMLKLFQGNTEDKLKALKIAEKLADKSTLPILRKSLRDSSLEVVEISAILIRKFK